MSIYVLSGLSLLSIAPGPFLFLMLCRLPRPTLFPYTTLFRSLVHRRFERGERARQRRALAARPARVEQDRALPLNPGGPGGDRKSTRLNSSHVRISYAVFCLKKKNRSEKTSFRSIGTCQTGRF